MIETVIKKIYDYFFEPAVALDLGVSRFLFFGIIFLLYLREPFSLWGKTPEVYYQLEPNPIFDYMNIPVFSPEIMGILGFVWLTSLLFSSIGFLTRLSTALAFITGAYLVGITKSFGHPPHTMFLATIIIGVLAVSYCGDAFSVDNLIRRKGWLRPVESRIAEGEYRWPIRLIWILIALAFCAAGVSKIRNSGVEWITSGYIASLFVYHGFTGNRSFPVFSWLPLWIANKPFLNFTLAAVTVIIEAGAPLVLFHPYLRIILLPMLFMMIVFFWVSMGIPFPDMLATFVFWIPWNNLAERFHLLKNTLDARYAD